MSGPIRTPLGPPSLLVLLCLLILFGLFVSLGFVGAAARRPSTGSRGISSLLFSGRISFDPISILVSGFVRMIVLARIVRTCLVL